VHTLKQRNTRQIYVTNDNVTKYKELSCGQIIFVSTFLGVTWHTRSTKKIGRIVHDKRIQLNANGV
jgi:hypothetical protein